MSQCDMSNGKSATKRLLNGTTSKTEAKMAAKNDAKTSSKSDSKTTFCSVDHSDSSDDSLPTEKLSMRVENDKVERITFNYS